MTQQSLITRLKAVEEAFEAAEAHLDFCGYGDSYERECAKEDKLPKRISDALSDLRELIKEADGQEPRAMPPKAHHATPFLEMRIAELERENAELKCDNVMFVTLLKQRVEYRDRVGELESALAKSASLEAALVEKLKEAEEALLLGARSAEALKRPCGMDPETPQSIRNGEYMSISLNLRAALAKIKEAS